jgi:hypothetical protein
MGRCRGGGAEKRGGVLLGAAAPLDTCTDESNGLATATSATMMGGTSGKCVTFHLSMA